MPQNIAAAKTTIGLIVSSTASMVGASTSAIALSDQLNQRHEFLYLDLPIWYFFTAVFALSAIGAVASLFTDTIKDSDYRYLSIPRKIAYVVCGFLCGIIGAFIILPSFTANPEMGIMMMTALVLSFSGMVLINNLSEIKRDDELQKSIRTLIVSRLTAVLNFLGGGKR